MVASALGSLLFDCEVALLEDGAKHGGNTQQYIHEGQLVVQRLETLSRPACPFARELLHHVQRICYNNGGRDMPDVQYLADVLASLGYFVIVRSALPGNGADCFKALRHEFIVVRGSGEFAGMEFIVEPALRQHFAIPHPSPDYSLALSHVPDVFVGGSCRLVPVVQLLCALMADSFERQGLALPPWRKEAAMLSKWLPLPHRMRDTPVTPPSAAPSAAAAAPYGAIDSAAHCDVAEDDAADRIPSAASHVSTESGESCSPMGFSPVSVLPPSRAAAVQSPNGNGQIFAVHGFHPLMSAAAAATTAAAATAKTAAGGGDGDGGGGSRSVQGLSQPPVGCSRHGAAADGGICLKRAFGGESCWESNALGSGGGSDSGSGRSGLLATKMAESCRTEASAAGGSGSGSSGSGLSERICTRPPTRPGEMAIRVVKLVGFNAPEQPPPPPQQKVQSQQPPEATLLPLPQSRGMQGRRILHATQPQLQPQQQNPATAGALLLWRRQLRHRAV